MKAFSLFLLSLLLFLAGLAVHFNDFIHQPTEPWAILIALVVSAGLFLGYALYSVSASDSPWMLLFTGMVVTGFLFAGVVIVEKEMTEFSWKRNRSPEDFGTFDHHVGVHAGRTIQFLWDKTLGSEVGRMREFMVGAGARIRHFQYLEKNNLLDCGDLDQIDCRVKWMAAFAAQGNWDYESRAFFHQDVQRLFQESGKADPMMNYVLKDQELDGNRRGILKLLGLDEELADRFLLIQQEDELNNLKLTSRIFQEASSIILRSNGTPGMSRVSDMAAGAQERLKKIPELEKDVERLQSSKPIVEEQQQAH